MQPACQVGKSNDKQIVCYSGHEEARPTAWSWRGEPSEWRVDDLDVGCAPNGSHDLGFALERFVHTFGR
jgi:hypothetical protein